MRILVTGLCSLHWGRLEYGNIGNYYMVEPTFRELHRVFPDAEIATTFQMTEEFCQREKVVCLPLELFYAWSENDLPNALKELGIATIYQETGQLVSSTPYIDEVLKSDLVIDFSGEMWGYHSDLVGRDRFLVGLLKDRVVQLLKKPIVMLAGSPGPFRDEKTRDFAKIVFKDFDFVANREEESIQILKDAGFYTANVNSYACPSFLFEPKSKDEMQEILRNENINSSEKKTVGFVLCGFNFKDGPYDKWPRLNKEYDEFADAVEYIINTLDARVVLLSHSNGFDITPEFKLKPGRDYPIVKQLQQVVLERGNVTADEVLCIDNVYTPKETKAIIGHFDMFITGRLHASVAAISQCVPTVIIMHGHGPKSYKIQGFSKLLGIENCVSLPESDDMIDKIKFCWENRDNIKGHLYERIPLVKNIAKEYFDLLPKYIGDK